MKSDVRDRSATSASGAAIADHDPYGLSLRWEVIATAGRLRTIDLFLNFPIMDMNRNAFWVNPTGVEAADIERMNAFWGDDSWRPTVYGGEQRSLFGNHTPLKTGTNEAVANAFQKRLKQIAAFQEVPELAARAWLPARR